MNYHLPVPVKPEPIHAPQGLYSRAFKVAYITTLNLRTQSEGINAAMKVWRSYGFIPVVTGMAYGDITKYELAMEGGDYVWDPSQAWRVVSDASDYTEERACVLPTHFVKNFCDALGK